MSFANRELVKKIRKYFVRYPDMPGRYAFDSVSRTGSQLVAITTNDAAGAIR
jgi:hypothetical protein